MTLRRLVVRDTAVDGFIDAIAIADGAAPLSEHKVARMGGAADAIVAAWGEGRRLVAVSVAAFHEGDHPHWALEVALGAEDRNDRLEEAAISAGASTLPQAVSSSLWVGRPDQVAAAEALGYRELRRVLRMDGPVPSGPEASEVELGPATEADTAGLVDVHNRAFAGHREASGMTEQGFDDLRAMPWYDPEGVITASVDGRLVGFCWTKLHPNRDGEVYLLAVDPDAHGHGIGELLTRAGYVRLQNRGAERAMLWVDGDNDPAIALYRRLGLETTRANVEMVRDS